MTREQLVDLVGKIMSSEATEEEQDRMVEVLESNVPHPRVLDLIYHPEREGLLDGASAEEIVDAALSYRPIAL
jgi:hypothetical protein